MPSFERSHKVSFLCIYSPPSVKPSTGLFGREMILLQNKGGPMEEKLFSNTVLLINLLLTNLTNLHGTRFPDLPIGKPGFKQNCSLLNVFAEVLSESHRG